MNPMKIAEIKSATRYKYSDEKPMAHTNRTNSEGLTMTDKRNKVNKYRSRLFKTNFNWQSSVSSYWIFDIRHILQIQRWWLMKHTNEGYYRGNRLIIIMDSFKCMQDEQVMRMRQRYDTKYNMVCDVLISYILTDRITMIVHIQSVMTMVAIIAI